MLKSGAARLGSRASGGLLRPFQHASTRILSRGIMNYYELFPQTLPKGAPPQGAFEIDVRALRKEYLKLQQDVHPDVSKDDKHYDAATLGTAYRVLSDPLLRTQHILKLNGIDPLSEASALHDEDLLMDIMLIRERASEADTPEEKKEIFDANEQRIENTLARVEKAFNENDLQEAHNAAIELSYWSKLRHQLKGEE